MPIKRAFYVNDFADVLKTMVEVFTCKDFCKGVLAVLLPKGPGGEDTTTEAFKQQVHRSANNWLRRNAKSGVIPIAKRKGWLVNYKNPHIKEEQPQPPKEAPEAPVAPQESLSLLDIGKGIDALISDLREDKDGWQYKYHELLRKHEDQTAELRDIKVDKENLNRRLNKQNTEILRLGNEAQRAKSSVTLGEVARFKQQQKQKGG